MRAIGVLLAGLMIPSSFGCSAQSDRHDAVSTKPHGTYFTPKECGWMSKDYFSQVFGSRVPKVTPEHNVLGNPPEVPSTYGCYAALAEPDGQDFTVLAGIVCPRGCTRTYQTEAHQQEHHEIRGLGAHAIWYPFSGGSDALSMLTSTGVYVSLVLGPSPSSPLRVDQVTALKAFAAKAEEVLRAEGREAGAPG